MSKAMTHIQTALCGQTLPSDDDAEAPDWVHLLPAGEVATEDRRGPYHVTDLNFVIAQSDDGAMRLPIDENHATDLAAPKGLPAPARGWIVELQARADGVWGRVEWTAAGRELVSSRAYRALSPVILHDKAKRVVRVLRASLVNRPNLRGLAALNQENDEMSFQERMAELLGLGADASETAIQSALETLTGGPDATALQSQIDQIGAVLGVESGGDVVAAARAAADDNPDVPALQQAVTALQTENAGLAEEVKGLRDATTRAAAETFVDGEIKRGRAGVKPLRDHYIAMHMEDPARVEKEIGALPVLSGSVITTSEPEVKDGEVALNAAQVNAATLLGIPLDDYKATLKEELQ